MTQTQYHGAILLSRGLEYTALVKPDGCPSWCFPTGCGHDVGKQAAATVVHSQTGIQVVQYLDDEYVEAEFPAGSGGITRLYIAHGLGTKALKPLRDAQISDAQWLHLADFLNLPEDTNPQEYPVIPFIPGLKAFIARRHEIRVGEPNIVLGRMLVYGQMRWTGDAPSQVLKTWLKEAGRPAPWFQTFEPPSGGPLNVPSAFASNRLRCATCTLPHLGVQITPEISYKDESHAIENSALAALMYLEGALDNHTPHINISACGFFPPPRLAWNEDDEHFKTMQREATALAGGGCYYRGNSAVLDPAAAACHRTKKHKTKSSQQPAKNEIQIVKELCDREKWMQPTYEYERRGYGNSFVCTISLARAGIESLAGPHQSTQKLAKLAAAKACLEKLIESGIYPGRQPTQTSAPPPPPQ